MVATMTGGGTRAAWLEAVSEVYGVSPAEVDAFARSVAWSLILK